MTHLNVKKLGPIPDGGWLMGPGARPPTSTGFQRLHKQRVGCTYLHSAVDGFFRLAYTEALDD